MEWWSRRGSWLGKAERQWRSKGRAKAPRSCWSYPRSGSCAELMVIGSVESEKGEAKDQSLFVAGINDLESEGGNSSADQIRDDVDPNLGELYQLHHARAHGYGRVEGAAGDGADGECADHHGHTDGQPVEGIVRRAFGSGDVEHNESERKSEDKLCYQRRGHIC